MERLIKTYALASRVPSISNAKLLMEREDAQLMLLSLVCSERNILLKENIAFKKFSMLQTENAEQEASVISSFVACGPSQKQEIAFSYSPSRNWYASIVERPNKNGEKTSQWLELWDKEKVRHSWNITAADIHGNIRTDGMFRGLQFSPDESRLVYSAEKKQAKIHPFTDFGKENGDLKSSGEIGSSFVFTESWGEQLVDVSTPLVFILDIEKSQFNKPHITGVELPEDCSYGQACWTPDGKGVVGVAWYNLPRRLGLIYCPNREGVVFHVTLDGKFTKISGDRSAVFSPRISPDGRKLVWLQTSSGGPHAPNQRLMMSSWDETIGFGEPQVVVETVDEDDGVFNGIYNADKALSERCWLGDSKHLVFSTECRSSMRSFIVNVETKKINEIQTDGSVTGCSALDVADNLAVFAGHSRTAPDSILLGFLDKDKIYAKEVIPPPELPIDFSHVRTRVFRLQSPDTGLMYEAILFYDMTLEEGKKQPLIVIPHGGPHTVFIDGFSIPSYYFVLLGYALLQVNYCGSTGFGNKNLLSLPGNCGTNDVHDVHAATLHVLDQVPSLDRNRVGLQGGSHGGFLVTHLSGQYPDFYRAVCARNPVVNLATMATVTDIPDWCAFESGIGQFDVSSFNYTPEVASKLLACSPIVHVQKVTAPTLVMVGEKDLRVPPSQGKEWYFALKSRGVKTKLLCYDDCHPLSKVENEMDHMISMAAWFDENM